jgi:hypothetical protein
MQNFTCLAEVVHKLTAIKQKANYTFLDSAMSFHIQK